MSFLPSHYLANFPVEYHRSQIASGFIGSPAIAPFHSSEIWFGRSFDAPRNHGEDAHNAIDIMGGRGLRIVASCSGVVAMTWRTRSGEFAGAGSSSHGGNYVMIVDNEEGYFHYYAHLQETPLVCAGQSVIAGQLLGYLGDTGRARGTPPHLHYQVSRRNEHGALVRFLNPYNELLRLVDRWHPRVSAGGRVVLPVRGGGPSGFSRPHLAVSCS
ncbi:hypothetical protein TDB9533_03798 [Thalassocella blandensis]|nr:hypothetical protein TDB9533_03798 [Thalassocella blandensis]